MRLALALAALVCSASSIQGLGHAATPPKYYFSLSEVKATSKAPAEVSLKARSLLQDVLATRPEFVTKLTGAPDPEVAPEDYRRFLATQKVAAYQVSIKITDFERSLEANDKPGKSGQILTIKIGVSLLGAKIPGGVLALAGTGGATIMAEVGATIRPREEEAAMDEALQSALVQAVDAAVTEMRRPPPKVKATKKKKAAR